MKHKFDQAVKHEHDVEVNTQDLEDLAVKIGEVTKEVIVAYMVADCLRHLFKTAVN